MINNSTFRNATGLTAGALYLSESSLQMLNKTYMLANGMNGEAAAMVVSVCK